jgi:hypothetical protein
MIELARSKLARDHMRNIAFTAADMISGTISEEEADSTDNGS